MSCQSAHSKNLCMLQWLHNCNVIVSISSLAHIPRASACRMKHWRFVLTDVRCCECGMEFDGLALNWSTAVSLRRLLYLKTWGEDDRFGNYASNVYIAAGLILVGVRQMRRCLSTYLLAYVYLSCQFSSVHIGPRAMDYSVECCGILYYSSCL